MPREIVRKPRLIYPQIATSLSIAELSMAAELLFWRILPQADDQGRSTGEPRQLKAVACPMREELTTGDIPELLAELEKAKLIIRYSNSSTDYIQIAKWWDYQAGMRRIFPSKYPAPEGWRDRVKGVRPSPEEDEDRQSVGQAPTDADDVPPKPEIVTRNSKPEPEPEPEEGIITAAAATETATESSTLETHEGSKGATETAGESELLRFLETLEGWRFGRAEDLAWLREFCQDWPDFGLSFAKACRDYHSGRPRPKHKGVWKNRFRNWMETEKKGHSDRKGGADGADKKYPAQVGPLTEGKRVRDVRGPLR